MAIRSDEIISIIKSQIADFDAHLPRLQQLRSRGVRLADDDAIRKALLTSLASFAALIESGVAFGQGYYFQRPEPLPTRARD